MSSSYSLPRTLATKSPRTKYIDGGRSSSLFSSGGIRSLPHQQAVPEYRPQRSRGKSRKSAIGTKPIDRAELTPDGHTVTFRFAGRREWLKSSSDAHLRRRAAAAHQGTKARSSSAAFLPTARKSPMAKAPWVLKSGPCLLGRKSATRHNRPLSMAPSAGWRVPLFSATGQATQSSAPTNREWAKKSCYAFRCQGLAGPKESCRFQAAIAMCWC